MTKLDKSELASPYSISFPSLLHPSANYPLMHVLFSPYKIP